MSAKAAASHVTQDNSSYAIVRHPGGERMLRIEGDANGFEGSSSSGAMECPLTPYNARVLRQRLPWLNPQPLGKSLSVGLGDRLGKATSGHIAAIEGTDIAPVFAQQSVRENQRTGRSPQQVLDEAMWALFECGWRQPWGADADHIKKAQDFQPFVQAGYSFYTIDPSDFVDDSVENHDLPTLRSKYEALNWQGLKTSPDELRSQILAFSSQDSGISFDEMTFLRAAVKYGNAVAHTAQLAAELRAMRSAAFDLEVSLDETETATTPQEHLFFAMQLKRLGVEWVSLAPRFVGRFEKGVDYIGDLQAFEENVVSHAAVIRHFGNSYKLSIHSGSDKFTIYPILHKHLKGLVHLKTAGTSYLEALRVMAAVEPDLFRNVLNFARGRYEEDRKTYHVSAEISRVPDGASLADEALPALLDDFHTRQVLHVTFGSVLAEYGKPLHEMLGRRESEYEEGLKRHLRRHVEPFTKL